MLSIKKITGVYFLEMVRYTGKVCKAELIVTRHFKERSFFFLKKRKATLIKVLINFYNK